MIKSHHYIFLLLIVSITEHNTVRKRASMEYVPLLSRIFLGMTVLRHEEFEKGCEAACNGPYDGKWSKTMIGKIL